MITAIILFSMLLVLIAVTSYINDKDEKEIRRLLCYEIRRRSNG